MFNRYKPAFTRGRFLQTASAALGLVAFPAVLQAAEPNSPEYTALICSGDTVIAAGSDLVRRALASYPDRPGRLFAGHEDGRTTVSGDGGASLEVTRRDCRAPQSAITGLPCSWT